MGKTKFNFDNEKYFKLLYESQGQERENIREQIILGNMPMVAVVLKNTMSLKIAKWHLRFDKPEFDDYFQTGVVGLIKAVDTYKLGMSKFSTYSSRCIENEMTMRMKKVLKHAGILSLDAELDKYNANSQNYCLYNKLPTNENMEENFIQGEGMNEIKNYIQHSMSELKRRVVLLRYFSGEERMGQCEIAQQLGHNQSYISRIEKNAIKELQVNFAENV